MSVILATSVIHIGLVVLELGLGLTPALVCAMKGKWGCLLVGVVVPFVWLVGAIRLAKPGSYWARRWYADWKMERSMDRFGRSQVRAPQ